MGVVPGSFRLVGDGSGSNEAQNYRAAYSKTWCCRTDNAADEADAVLADSACPKVGDNLVTPAGIYPGVWAKKVTATRDPVVYTLWRVAVNYDNQKPHDADLSPNPLLKPARIWWSFQKTEVILPYDRRGNWYVNAAGDYLSDPPPTPLTLSILNIVKNVGSYSPGALNAAHNCVNTDTFLDWLPGYCRVGSIEPGEPQTEGNFPSFSRLVTQIECSPIPFHPWPCLNQGPRYLDAPLPGGKPVQNNTDGVYSDAQALLAANGTKLPPGLPPTVIFRYPNPEMPFAALAWLAGLVVTP
jgi:hypothetical protein